MQANKVISCNSPHVVRRGILPEIVAALKGMEREGIDRRDGRQRENAFSHASKNKQLDSNRLVFTKRIWEKEKSSASGNIFFFQKKFFFLFDLGCFLFLPDQPVTWNLSPPGKKKFKRRNKVIWRK